MRLPSRTKLLALLVFATCAAMQPLAAAAATDDREKPRLFVLTDIGGDPDDAMSLVRLLTYANHVDIEGLVATEVNDEVNPQRIRTIVSAYGEVRDNLETHESGFPTAEYLLDRTTQGLPIGHMDAVGEGKDSAGSEALIAALDADDDRPLWVTVWGGPNTLAQALWKLRETRNDRELAAAVAKLRVYAISDQDNSGPWIRKEFPELFYIVTPGINAGGGFHHATWIAIGGDRFHGRFGGADFSLVTNEWLGRNIRIGPLGAEYPHWEFMMEGDTPSFMNLLDTGLSDPERPDWGGWGGRYELYTPKTEKWFLEPETRPIWTNVQDEVLGIDGEWHTTNHATIWRWRSDYQNDFAARMQWTVTEDYDDANHPPVPKLDHPARFEANPGERVELSATATTDPDGDALSYHWFVYEEPGTRSMSNARNGIKLDIVAFDQPKAWFNVKTSRVMPPGTGTMHIILAVTDHGEPRLTRYQRVIVDVVE